MKFRTRLREIEAVCWQPGVVVDYVCTGIQPGMPQDIWECVRDGVNPQVPKCAALKTLEGWKLVLPGDWLILREGKPPLLVKPDVFAENYEACD